jgi:hypothetical protein
MAHSVAEVRAMTRLASEMNLATQLGVQRLVLDNAHRVVELIQGGAIGKVRECHCWVGVDRGMPPRPADFPPVPPHLNYAPPEKTIPNSPGFYREWLDAGRGGPPATCNFQYTGPMTETILLGNVAYRSGQTFDWDADQLRPRGNVDIEAFIRPPYRKGWDV